MMWGEVATDKAARRRRCELAFPPSARCQAVDPAGPMCHAINARPPTHYLSRLVDPPVMTTEDWGVLFSRPRSEGWPCTPWTYFLHLSLSSVIDSSTGSPVHVLMLSIQAVRGLPRLREPGTVPCIISFSTQLPCFLKSLRTHLFVFFAVHETRRISLSTFISKAPINDTDRATRWNWATKLCWILSKDISRTRLFDYYCYCKNNPFSN